jgi:MFS family permease
MVMLSMSIGMMYSFGVMIDFLIEEHGWSRGTVSFAYSLQFLVGIPVVLAVGWLAERIGSRPILMTAAVIFMIGTLATATVTQVWQFHLYFGVFIGGLAASTFVTLLPVILTRWFDRKLGLATGLMWASTSAGPAVFAPLMRWTLGVLGWSDSFIVFGLITGTLVVGSSFIPRDHPREKNLTPYGELRSATPLTDAAPPVETLGLHKVMLISSFWALVAVHFFGCVGHSVPLAHMVSMATFAGLSGITAAGVQSTAAAVSLVSRFGMSLLAEAKGARFTLTIVLLLQTLPMLLLLNATELPSFYSFAFLFGLGYGGEMVGFPIYNRQYYGADAPLNTIYSYQMAGAMLGMAVGGWGAGALFDLTGDYTWSILASMGGGFLGLSSALLLPSITSRHDQP